MSSELPVVADPHPWRAAIWLGLLAIAGGMFVAIVVPVLRGRAGWWIPGDAWMSLRAAHYVPQGTYPLIYETGTAHDVFDAGPLLPLVLAPVAAIGNLFRLQESYPFPRPYPDMWPVFGPYALASGIPMLYAVRALATQLGVRRRRAILQMAVLVLAFVPMAIVYGHYEDVLALALVFLAFRDVFAERPLRGALLVGAAILFKQWSVLVFPVFVAACPAPVRLRATLRCLLPPALFLSAFLAADYTYASAALLHPSTFPLVGHAALWVSPTAAYLTNVPERPGAFVVALVVAWLVRRERDPAFIMSALGCVLLSRFLFESVVHAYYLAPGIAALLVSEWSRRRSIVTNFTLGAALLLAFPFHPARGLWWSVVYTLVALVLYRPVVQLVRRSKMGHDAVATATTVRSAVFAGGAPASNAGTM